MKNKRTVWAILLAFIFALILAACPGPDQPGPDQLPDPPNPFTSIAEMKSWLDAAPTNTVATAYTIKLNVGDLGGYYYTAGSAGNALFTNNNKYVRLDLSGSTFTSIGPTAFSSYYLIGVTIPDTVTSIGSSAFSGTSLTSVTFATGSNITNFGDLAFPEGGYRYGGDTLRIAYNTGKAGTYTRPANGTTWTKQS